MAPQLALMLGERSNHQESSEVVLGIFTRSTHGEVPSHNGHSDCYCARPVPSNKSGGRRLTGSGFAVLFTRIENTE
jgi:hypothetical protein